MIEIVKNCSTCIHAGVCQYQERLEKYQSCINNVRVVGDHCEKFLIDIEWIRPIRLECNYWKPIELTRELPIFPEQLADLASIQDRKIERMKHVVYGYDQKEERHE